MPTYAIAKVDRRKPQPFPGPFLSAEDHAARCEAFRESRRIEGRNVGLVTLDANGNVYEWCSWERMMSE